MSLKCKTSTRSQQSVCVCTGSVSSTCVATKIDLCKERPSRSNLRVWTIIIFICIHWAAFSTAKATVLLLLLLQFCRLSPPLSVLGLTNWCSFSGKKFFSHSHFHRFGCLFVNVAVHQVVFSFFVVAVSLLQVCRHVDGKNLFASKVKKESRKKKP